MKAFDVVVVGAGIHGAGIAQAAAACGLRVLIVERNSHAGLETSSASSKLIHGGLRYLETGQWRLVFECLRERRLLLRIAPALVRPQTFYLPVYRHSSRSPALIRLGLLLYRLLGGHLRGTGKGGGFDELQRATGLLEADRLAVFSYTDAQTDDAALTRAVMRSAIGHGAEARYSETIVHADANRPGTCTVTLQSGEQVACRVIVNAAGPWANQVAERIEGAPVIDFDWVQGTHIELAIPALPGCFYVEAPADRRAVFILPWKGRTLVGTTETRLTAPDAQATPEEIDYLLATFNLYFPEYAATTADVEHVFAGVRVLPRQGNGSSPNRRSRETVIAEATLGDCRYLGIYGGKLTSYRATAEKVLRRMAPAIALTQAQIRVTRTIALAADIP